MDPVKELAAAIRRTLSKPNTQSYKRGCYPSMTEWVGYHGDRVGDWFGLLCCDEKWFAIADRPHETTEFRKVIKANAKVLHEQFNLVVTLKGSYLSIDDLDRETDIIYYSAS